MQIKPDSPTMLEANRPILGSMLVKEAREIKAAQRLVIRRFERAALNHLKKTEGRDLVAELPGWTSFTVETDHRLTGKVVVKQYLHDERSPKLLRYTWVIPKSALLAPSRK